MFQDMESFIKRHKKAVILNFITVCICYIHMAFSQNIGIDTEIMIMGGSSMLKSWYNLGRQGLVLSKILLNLTQYNPYFSGVLFLIGFGLLGILTAFLCWVASGKNDNYFYGLFMILFSTCPIWMMQFYFALQRAEVIFGLLCAVISVFSLCQIIFYRQRKIYWILAYVILGIWSFCSYQSCIVFYITLCMMFFLMDFVNTYKDRQWKEYAKTIIQLISGFVVIFLINQVVTQVFFWQGDYLDGQIGWGNRPVTEIFLVIAKMAGKSFICYGAEYSSAYPLAVLCIFIVFVRFCRKQEIKRAIKFIFFFALAGLMASPFLLTIYMGNTPVPRSQFVLQLVGAFGCMFTCGIWKIEENPKCQWMPKGVSAVSCVIIWLSLSAILRLQYTDDVRFQEDVRMAYEVAEEIQHTEGANGLPVIFVGGKMSHLNDSARETDMYGYSTWGWDYSPQTPVNVTARVIWFMQALGLDIEAALDYGEQAIKAAKDMECYPKSGYISVQEGFVAVKLSEVD